MFCTFEESFARVHHKEGAIPSQRMRQMPVHSEVIERFLDKPVALFLVNGYCHSWKPTTEHSRQVYNSPLLCVPTLFNENRGVIEIRIVWTYMA